MRKGLTLAQIDELEAQEKARTQAEKEAKRVAAQQKRKEEAQLRAAAKKVAQEMVKAPDPKPRATETQPAQPYIPVSSANQAAVEEAYALPYEPPSYHFGPNDDPYAELAQRELCRRKLLPFIQRFRPKYEAGWVHEDICRRIERFVEQVEQGLSPRLLLLCPPRMGKSEIGSRHTPAWVLGRHPDWEIIAASHTSSLSLSFSRYLRDVMRDPAYTAVFPETLLDSSSQSVENWNLTKGGGYMAAGVGTGITGRGCLAPYSLVDTNRGKIRIIDLKVGDSVYGYDHEQQKVVETRVKAVQVTERSKQLLDFGKVRLTTDHCVYNAARGFYTRAGESPNLLGLRRQEGSSRCDVQSVLFQSADRGDHNAQMQLLWEELSAQRGRVPEIAGSARQRGESVLQSPLLRHVQDQQPGGLQQGERGVFALQEACYGDGSFEVLQQGLLQRVQGFKAGDGCVQWRISDAENAGVGAGQWVPAVRYDPRSVRGASHQSGRDRQPDFESGSAVCGVPPQISSVHGACAADIAAVFAQFDFVVDIQTETGNFFTEGLLVHNCHILLIDDVVKDAEAAQSLTIRDNTWEWYLSTAYTRIAPGGGVLGILTWWHEDDWAGRLQQAILQGDGDNFEIVKYPAINDYGDEYILPDDSIVQIPHGNPVPEGSRLTRPINTAVHPARYTTEMMLKIKRNLIAGGQKRVWDALYQQNPIPDDGNYFTKDMFRYYGTAPARNELYIYQAWDFAISTGKESDYTVGTCIGVDHRENVYVLDVMRFRSGDGGHIIDSILDFAEAHNADCLGFEDGQIWKAIEFQFQKRCEERRQYPSHEVLKPLTDKMVRASPLRGRMQLGKVYFDKHAPWFDPVYKELVTFPAGKHDDCCFVAGTQIVMADGTSRAIELVRIGDMVETPLGPRPVTAAAMTSPRATVYEVAGLVGTAGHPIYTQNRGWVPLVTLTESDILQVRESVSNEESSCQGFTKKQQRTSTVWSSMESCIVATRTLIGRIFAATTRALVGEVSCTETCGSSTTGLSQKAGSSTTSTRTTSTTTFPTLSACPGKSTQSTDTQNRMLTALLKNSLRTSLAFVRKLLSGTVPQKASLGTARTEKMLGKIVSASHWSVPIAETSSGRTFPMLSSVQSPAGTSIGTKLIPNTTLPKMLAEERPVFNITVSDAHCYYANDVLVHNCDSLAWAIRLTLTRAAPRAIETRPKMKSWKDKLLGSSRGGSHMAA